MSGRGRGGRGGRGGAAGGRAAFSYPPAAPGWPRGIPKTAKRPFNQPALDKLFTLSQETRYLNSAHYPRVFKKGMAAVGGCKEDVTSVEEALKLKGVGAFLAGVIGGTARKHAEEESGEDCESEIECLDGESDDAGGRKRPRPPPKVSLAAVRAAARAENGGKGKKRATTVRRSDTADSAPARMNGGNDGDNNDDEIPPTGPGWGGSLQRCTSLPAAAPTRRGRKRKAPKPPPPPSTTSSSAKSRAYAKSILAAEGVHANLHLYTDWTAILLLDKRERRADHVQAKLRMSGLNCEQRNLPIGDMLWIARGRRRSSATGGGTPNGGAFGSLSQNGPAAKKTKRAMAAADDDDTVEVVLGTVIERKTLDDLVSSLYGTRFEEQRLRLKHSAAGASQVIYLVEGTAVTDRANCPAGTLRYAMMQTCAHMGFAVVRTKSLDDTVRFLKGVHRRLLRRAFPTEFAASSFSAVASHAASSPNCSSGGAGMTMSQDSASSRSLPTFSSPPAGHRSRAPSGLQSDLLTMTFDTPPQPYDSSRLRLYDEFRAKLELARESGTRSVGAVFRAMLKQVESFSSTKIHPLTAKYPTPSKLVGAYMEAAAREDRGEGRQTVAGTTRGGGKGTASLGAVESLVKDVKLNDRMRLSQIGPKSSAELGRVFTIGLSRASSSSAAAAGEGGMSQDSNVSDSNDGRAGWEGEDGVRDVDAKMAALERSERTLERGATATAARSKSSGGAASSSATSSVAAAAASASASSSSSSSVRLSSSSSGKKTPPKPRAPIPGRTTNRLSASSSSSKTSPYGYASGSLRAGLSTTGGDLPCRHMSPEVMGAYAAAGLFDGDADGAAAAASGSGTNGTGSGGLSQSSSSSSSSSGGHSASSRPKAGRKQRSGGASSGGRAAKVKVGARTTGLAAAKKNKNKRKVAETLDLTLESSSDDTDSDAYESDDDGNGAGRGRGKGGRKRRSSSPPGGKRVTSPMPASSLLSSASSPAPLPARVSHDSLDVSLDDGIDDSDDNVSQNEAQSSSSTRKESRMVTLQDSGSSSGSSSDDDESSDLEVDLASRLKKRGRVDGGSGPTSGIGIRGKDSGGDALPARRNLAAEAADDASSSSSSVEIIELD